MYAQIVVLITLLVLCVPRVVRSSDFAGDDSKTESVREIEDHYMVFAAGVLQELVKVKHESTGADNERRIPISFKVRKALRKVELYRIAMCLDWLTDFAGTTFCIYSESDNPRLLESGKYADQALFEIGLPAVDHILNMVAKGPDKKVDLMALRTVVIRLLGEDGLSGRAHFLKIHENENFKKFLSGDIGGGKK